MKYLIYHVLCILGISDLSDKDGAMMNSTNQSEQFKVILYEKRDGSVPLRDFINGMDAKLHARTLRMIELLRERGNELREPYTKPLADGIFELRIQSGTNAARIFVS